MIEGSERYEKDSYEAPVTPNDGVGATESVEWEESEESAPQVQEIWREEPVQASADHEMWREAPVEASADNEIWQDEPVESSIDDKEESADEGKGDEVLTDSSPVLIEAEKPSVRTEFANNADDIEEPVEASADDETEKTDEGKSDSSPAPTEVEKPFVRTQFANNADEVTGIYPSGYEPARDERMDTKYRDVENAQVSQFRRGDAANRSEPTSRWVTPDTELRTASADEAANKLALKSKPTERIDFPVTDRVRESKAAPDSKGDGGATQWEMSDHRRLGDRVHAPLSADESGTSSGHTTAEQLLQQRQANDAAASEKSLDERKEVNEMKEQGKNFTERL